METHSRLLKRFYERAQSLSTRARQEPDFSSKPKGPISRALMLQAALCYHVAARLAKGDTLKSQLYSDALYAARLSGDSALFRRLSVIWDWQRRQYFGGTFNEHRVLRGECHE